MNEQEEEKNTNEGTSQSYNIKQKTPPKFGKINQLSQNSNQYGELEKSVMDKLRKTSSTFSFRDEGPPIIQEDGYQDQSFEKNINDVTPCKSPLNQSDNIPYDISDNGIPSGKHNLANSYVKRNLGQNYENILNPNLHSPETGGFQQNNNVDSYSKEQQNTPQLNSQPLEVTKHPQVQSFNQKISRNSNKNEQSQKKDFDLQDIQNEKPNSLKGQMYDNEQNYQNTVQKQQNIKKPIEQNRQQNEINSLNILNDQNIQNKNSSNQMYEEEELLEENPTYQLQIIAEGDSEDDAVQDEQIGEQNFQLQYKQESAENNNSINQAIKIIQNQSISISNSNKDLDNNYWESNSALDMIHPQYSSASNHSLKEKESNKTQQHQLQQKESNRSQLQVPFIKINPKNMKKDEDSLPNFRQSDIKNPKAPHNQMNSNFLNLQQSADFLSSQQTTPRGENGQHSPYNFQNDRDVQKNNQQIPIRNSEYQNIYQEFLKKEKNSSSNSPQVQEDALARFGASDCSSLPEEDSINGENNNQYQNNTFMSNNMSTILHHLNDGYSNNQQQQKNTQNQQQLISQNQFQQNHIPSCYQPKNQIQLQQNSQQQNQQQQNQYHQKQQINELNSHNNTVNNNYNSNNVQLKKWQTQNNGQNQIDNYLPQEIIGSRELATTESYSTQNQSYMNKEIESLINQQNNMQSKQISNLTNSNIADQAFIQSSHHNPDNYNHQPVRSNINQIGFAGQNGNHLNEDSKYHQTNYNSNLNQQNNMIHQNLNENQTFNANQMQQMFQNFMSTNQNYTHPSQQTHGNILTDLNNSRVTSYNIHQTQPDHQFQQQNFNVPYSQEDDIHKNQQQMNFFNQQHVFVMNIMNFYEFHLNKMKQIAMEKTQEVVVKCQLIFFQMKQKYIKVCSNKVNSLN